MSWLSMSRLKSHYSQTYTSSKAASITKYWNEQHCHQKLLEQTTFRLTEKLEAGLKRNLPYTGGHFLCLVAWIIPNSLKCSSFQRPDRVLAMREFRLSEWKKTRTTNPRQKRVQGNINKDLCRTQVPDPRLSSLGCLLALEKTQFDRYLLFPLHNAQVPWAAPLYTSRSVSAQMEKRSWASSSASAWPTLRDRAWAQPGGRNHLAMVQFVSKSERCR